MQTMFDPCTLFPKDDASVILGVQADVKPDAVAPLCTYTHATTPNTPTGGNTADMRELLVAIGTSTDARGYFNRDRIHRQSDTSQQDISGLGDAAFMLKFPQGQAVVVLKQTIVYSITALNFMQSETSTLDGLKKLASKAENTIARTSPTLPIESPQPCTLVTPGEASHVLKQPDPQWLFTMNDAGVAGCDYLSSLGVSNRVQVVLTNNATQSRNIYQHEHSAVKQKTDLQSLGDAAFFTSSNTIWVLKKESVFHISVLGEAAKEPAIEQLARTAVSRL